MRKRREWYPGAVYHIMQRGLRRSDIFHEEDDYLTFMSLLQIGIVKYQCKLHAFCLMTNHYHMLVETSDIEISRFAKYLSQNYAVYFNRKYGFKGHLFEDRFTSGLVKNDSYFLQTSKYIHLNPVKALIVKSPEEYRWSSYRAIIGLEENRYLNSKRTMEYFGEGESAQEKYSKFVELSENRYFQYEEEIQTSMKDE